MVYVKYTTHVNENVQTTDKEDYGLVTYGTDVESKGFG